MHHPDCFSKRNLLAEKDAEIADLQDHINGLTIKADLLGRCVEDLVIFAVVEANRQRMTEHRQYLHDSHARLIMRAYKAIGSVPRQEWVDEHISPAVRSDFK